MRAAYNEAAITQLLIDLLLLLGHVCIQEDLLLGRQAVLDI